jgi:NADH-quinone oxidoreductase subunit C/D
MDAPALIAALQEDVPGASLEAAASADLHTTIYASPGDLPAIARALRDRPDLRCVFLAELTAVDLHPREPRFELVYMLVSLEHRFRLRVKVRLGGNVAHVQTVSDVWPAANWLEREVWDLFGIAFEGHPRLKRILLPPTWQGHPLRKEYPARATEFDPYQLDALRQDQEQEALRFRPEEWGMRLGSEDHDYMFLNLGPNHPSAHGSRPPYPSPSARTSSRCGAAASRSRSRGCGSACSSSATPTRCGSSSSACCRCC